MKEQFSATGSTVVPFPSQTRADNASARTLHPAILALVAALARVQEERDHSRFAALPEAA